MTNDFNVTFPVNFWWLSCHCFGFSFWLRHFNIISVVRPVISYQCVVFDNQETNQGPSPSSELKTRLFQGQRLRIVGTRVLKYADVSIVYCCTFLHSSLRCGCMDGIYFPLDHTYDIAIQAIVHQ